MFITARWLLGTFCSIWVLKLTCPCRFEDNPKNPNQVLITDPDNEPENPFSVPESCPSGGFGSDAFSISEDPGKLLRAVSSKRQAKHERRLQQNRDAPESHKTKHHKSGKSKRRKGGK